MPTANLGVTARQRRAEDRWKAFVLNRERKKCDFNWIYDTS